MLLASHLPKVACMCTDSSSSTHLSLIQESILNPHNLEAGNKLYQKYARIIQRVARSMGFCEEDIEDLIQETLQRMIMNFPRFTRRRKGSFRAWVRRITRSNAVDWIRKNPRENCPKPRALGHAVAMSIVCEYDTELLEFAIRKVRLEIQPSQWEMFEHVRLEGRSAMEIAGRHGVTVHAVYKAGLRVAQRIREILVEMDKRGPQK